MFFCFAFCVVSEIVFLRFPYFCEIPDVPGDDPFAIFLECSHFVRGRRDSRFWHTVQDFSVISKGQGVADRFTNQKQHLERRCSLQREQRLATPFLLIF